MEVTTCDRVEAPPVAQLEWLRCYDIGEVIPFATGEEKNSRFLWLVSMRDYYILLKQPK